ncbi:glycosyltransferase family 2 protein [Paenibacillus sp. MER 180]|uniref:glycosyltransferase family 2 protein n=1 Tax=Paenibacillus sp. MER 180 TaxID=2939570 RepID=UPI002040DB12|nr:glycosyltransferase family 2 protein [Paenibacillus sp. MER 180]MCM3288523.1 glycosyltransferase family 2 protein [Paenibacillus sp. MER 180]
MQISIVTTLYRSEAYLVEFHERIKKALSQLNMQHEIIMVNDGSPDNSLDTALKIRDKDSAVKVIDLSRNFGHHKAILTGLSYATGEIIYLIDCDLEEEPELLVDFYQEWEKDREYDVIYGVQDIRDGSYYKKVAGSLFYKIFNSLSDTKIKENICTVRLMSRRYVDALLSLQDKNVFLAALFEHVGYKQKEYKITKKYKGKSSYNFLRKIALMTEAITSFSSKPLSIIMLTGLTLSSMSIVYAIYLIFRRIFINSIIGGWTSLMVSVWFLGGIILFSIGTLGIYISKIYNESKQRPITVVKKIYN